MTQRGGATLHPSGLIAFEDGSRFGEWSFHATGSAGWSVPVLSDYHGPGAIGFNNNAGSGIGLALFRLVATDFQLDDIGAYEDAHTVHLRVTHGNSTPGDAYCLGPATACHSVPSVNGYAVGITNDGTPRIVLAKIASGVVTPLALVTMEVFTGHVISLSYRWDSVNSFAELAMLVNGAPVEFQPGSYTTTDTTSAYEIGAVTNGRFGLFGGDSRPIQSGAVAPEVAYEWWVTGGWVSYAEPPSLSQRTAGFRVNILQRQRFASATAPPIRRMVSGAILNASWSHQRMGGNKTLSARFKLPSVSGSEHVDAKSFSDPSYEDWASSHWLGGEVVLEYQTTEQQTTDVVWRGRLSRVSVDEDGVISINAEGLVGDLDNLFVSRTYMNEKVITILEAIFTDIGKGSESGGVDTYVRYEPSKIVGAQSVLDTRIDVDFQWESARSALDRIFEFLPGNMVWGVDREGDLYISQEADYYTEDNAGGGIQHFTVDDHAVRMEREVDLKRIRTAYVVLGDEIEDDRVNVHRIQGAARCERARQLFGLRGAVHQESGVTDTGTASRLAAIRLKKLTTPVIAARLEVTRPIHAERDLHQTLVAGASRIAVTDRRSRVSLSSPTDEMGIDDYTSTEYTLRRFGDATAYATNEQGSAGGGLVMPSVFREQVLDRDWLLHIVVSNIFLHPGSIGDTCFLFGRPRNASPGEGWGALWWMRDGADSGHLEWRYENQSAVNRVIDTGITLDPLGLGNQVVHFTVFRDSAGVLKFFDGNTQTGSEAGFASDIPAQDTWDWKAFDHGNTGLPATQVHGDASMDQMWLIKTDQVKGLSGGVAQMIADANGGPLPRARARGLIRYLPMQEPAGAATRSLASWLDDGNLAPRVALATWTRSEAAGTGDGAQLSNGARGLHIGKEKKWGGPLILAAETVSYEIDGSTGLLTRSYTLGDIGSDIWTTLALLQQEVRRQNEARRRVEEVA